MKELSRLALQVEPSATMAIDTMFKQMKADGIDVIGFGAGEPDFPTPTTIKEAGIRAIENNDTRYTPSVGTLEIRKAISARLKEDYNISYEPSQIAVSNGAKTCVCVALQVLINEGDEIILPAPYWVSYIEIIRMLGGVPVVIDSDESDHFKITAEKLKAAITPKTKAIILNNPSNPTGMIYTRDELEAMGNVCVDHEVYIIADEIYSDLVYNGTFHAIAAISERIKAYTLTINGVSKSYAMTGWRIGYICTEGELSKVIANYLSHSTGSPCAVSQKAASFALTEPQDFIEDMRRIFHKRRNIMVELMNQVENVSCIMPDGAFYVMMNIEKLIGMNLHGKVIHNADEFASLFLEYGKVAVVPGTSFGAPNFVRWSYSTSEDNIREGISRLGRFLAGEII